MDPQQLRETVTQIHRELEQAESVDDSSREVLIQLLHDLERLVGVESGEARQQGVHSLLGRLRGSVEQFEESHPFLASLICRIADGLSNMGI